MMSFSLPHVMQPCRQLLLRQCRRLLRWLEAGSDRAVALPEAQPDPLLALPGRTQLLLHLQSAIAEPQGLALLFIRLQRAGMLRSTLGPERTLALHAALLERLQEIGSDGRYVARLSGSSYALVLPIARPLEAMSIAYAVAGILARSYHIADREVQLPARVGVAVCGDQAADAGELLRHAEMAVHLEQAGRQDGVVLFDHGMRRVLDEQQRLESDLRRAVYFAPEQLRVVYQPIVDLPNLRLVGFEALARWQHPEQGMIPPDRFIAVAEQTGLIVPLWNLIFGAAAREQLEWARLRPDLPLFVSVNLSAHQFVYPGLLKSVETMADLLQFDPGRIKLEITESALMENAELAMRQLQTLRQMGFRLSIDDFGTGYSSLSYLHRLPVDDLKIDRSFIAAMQSGRGNREIVRTVAELARLVGMRVTAEGVEHAHELAQLRQLRIDYAQGYFFSRPVEAAQARQQVRDGLPMPVISEGLAARTR